MKKILVLISASVMILFTAACNKEQEKILGQQDNDFVYITASIDPETKSTLNDGNPGAFAFSYGDAIKVSNGSGTFSGTTTSTENSGTFAMEVGFDGSKSGIAGFPASLVSDMTSSSVTFTLPTSYEYNEVGGTDPNASKVPCPMIGDYNGTTQKVTLKQAGAVVRFRVTNVLAGSLSFVFETKVTGEATIGVPSGSNDGILATGLTAPGNTITINNVPTVSGTYVYITIPVPTGTVPNSILVTNEPSDASKSRIQSLTGSEDALSRAHGYKLSVSPEIINIVPEFTINASGNKVVLAPGNLMAQIGSYNSETGVATAASWKFGGSFERVGNSSTAGNYLLANGNGECVGQWVDLFLWQGASVPVANRVHGLIDGSRTDTKKAGRKHGNIDPTFDDWYGNDDEESLYSGCWVFNDIVNGGGYTWRPLSLEEWNYIFGYRATSTLNGVDNARHARATVAGINGILIFPDNIGEVWTSDESVLGPRPVSSEINKDKISTGGSKVSFTYGSANNYTAAQMVQMAKVGVVFLANSGYRTGTTLSNDDETNKYGYYWTSTGTCEEFDVTCASYLRVAENYIGPVTDWFRWVGRPVRLARDIE